MGASMDLDDLMGELGVDSTSSDALVEYLNECGGFDVIRFETKKKAKEYYESSKLTIDLTQIMIVRKKAEVWLYLMDFYYKLEDIKEPEGDNQ